MDGNAVDIDVLVVGSGGAGLRAAIGAREKGARTLVVSKGPLARSGATPLAGADLTADGYALRQLGFFGEPRDSKQTFFEDILHQGFFLNDQRLVEIYVEDAPQRLGELIEWGVKVSLAEERAIFTSGTSILDALLRRAKAIGVEAVEDVMVLELLTREGQVVGALGLDINSGEFVTLRAKAVVLATGGWHKAYWPNTGTRELSGEGQAVAYRAGARLANTEFVTFAANVLLWPPRWCGNLITYILHLLAGGRLVNSEGQDILAGYPRDVVDVGTSTEWNKSFLSIVSMSEVRAGRGSPHGGVIYQIGDVPWDTFERKAAVFFPDWRYKGGDYSSLGRMLKSGEPVEVGPVVEYFEGGVVVDSNFATDVPGLYAAGECALSLFGANRVAAATTEMLVSGAIAGRCAGEYATRVQIGQPDHRQVEELYRRAILPLERSCGTRPVALRGSIRANAHQRLGPVRSGEEVAGFLVLLDEVRADGLLDLCPASKSRRYNKEWIEALELTNIVQMLEISARAALSRTESRGVHYRTDYPQTDNDRWLKEIVIRQIDGELQLASRPVTITTLDPPGGVVPYLEMVQSMMAAHSDVGGHH